MAARTTAFDQFQQVTTAEEYAEKLEKPGLTIVDVYTKWAGPCEAMSATFKRLRLDTMDMAPLNIIQAQSDAIPALEAYQKHCKPVFLLYWNGVLLRTVEGCNAPQIERTVRAEMDNEAAGREHVPSDPQAADPATAVGGTDPADPSATGRPSTTGGLGRGGPSLAALALSSGSRVFGSHAHLEGPDVSETAILVKPHLMQPSRLDAFLAQLRSARFEIRQTKKVWLAPALVAGLLAPSAMPGRTTLHTPRDSVASSSDSSEPPADAATNAADGEEPSSPVVPSLSPEVEAYYTSGPLLAIRVRQVEALDLLHQLVGPEDPAKARTSAPRSLRALQGLSPLENGVWIPPDIEASARALVLLFDESLEPSRVLVDGEITSVGTPQKTVLLVHPRALRVDHLGVDAGASDAADATDADTDGRGLDAAVETIVQRLVWRGFTISRRETQRRLTPEQVAPLLAPYSEQGWFGDAVAYWSHDGAPDGVAVLVVKGEDVVRAVRELAGNVDPQVARSQGEPASFRALLGRDLVQNGVWVADTSEQAVAALDTLFPSLLAGDGTFMTRHNTVSDLTQLATATHVGGTSASTEEERTVAIFKPEVARQTDLVPQLLQQIEAAGFRILVQQTRTLLATEIETMYAHVGQPVASPTVWPSMVDVVPETLDALRNDLVTANTTAPCLVLVLAKVGAISAWRALIGPTDPDVARTSAPQSWRALYGHSLLNNGFHGARHPDAVRQELAILFPPLIEGTTAPHLPLRRNRTVTLVAAAAATSTDADAAPEPRAQQVSQSLREHGVWVPAQHRIAATTAHHASRYHVPEGVPAIALLLEGRDVLGAWRDTLRREAVTCDGDATRLYAPATPQTAADAIAELFADAADGPVATAPADEQTCAIVKPDAIEHAALVEAAIHREDQLEIVQRETLTWTPQTAEAFYAEHHGKPFYATLVGFMTSGPIQVMTLAGPGAIGAWRGLAGPTNSERARQVAPTSLRARFGTDGTHNAVHGSDSPAAAAREINIAYQVDIEPTDAPASATRSGSAGTSKLSRTTSRSTPRVRASTQQLTAVPPASGSAGSQPSIRRASSVVTSGKGVGASGSVAGSRTAMSGAGAAGGKGASASHASVAGRSMGSMSLKERVAAVAKTVRNSTRDLANLGQPKSSANSRQASQATLAKP